MASMSESVWHPPSSLLVGSTLVLSSPLTQQLQGSAHGDSSDAFAPLHADPNLPDVEDVPAEEETDLETTNAALAAAESNAALCDPTDLPSPSGPGSGVAIELAGRRLSVSQAGAVMRGDESVLSHRAAAAAAAVATAASQGSSNASAGRKGNDSVSVSMSGAGVRTGSIYVEGAGALPYQSWSSPQPPLEEAHLNGWSVRFNWARFIEEFIVHALGPFAHPYLHCRYSAAYAANHQLLEAVGRGWVGFWAWCAFVTVNLLQGLYGTSSVVTFSEVLIATLVFLSRNAIISAKYAYLSPIQIHDRMKRVIPREELSNQLLLGGWLRCPRQTQIDEIDHAFKRLGINETEKSYATFVGHSREQVAEQLSACVPDEEIPTAHAHWKLERERGRLHLRLLAQQIVGDSVSSLRFPRLPLFAFLLALLHCFIPIFVRWHQGFALFGSHWYDTCMIVFCLFISLPNYTAGLMFVLTAFIDYQRRVFLMHRCSALLIDPMLIAGLHCSATQVQLPLLNFSKANNVGLWLELRQIFKDFGLQFFHRVQAYASFWVLTVLAMLVFLFYQLLFQHVTDPTGIVLVSYDLAVFSFALLVMLQAAHTLNKQHVEHRKILLKKLSDMQRHVSLLGKSDAASTSFAHSVKQAKKMVKVAIQVIETDDELAPVKILGFDANANLVRALVTAAGSGLLAAGKLLAEER